METPDLVALYFPSFSELPASQVASMRQRLQTLLRAGFPDIDYRPNSPLGDLGLTPIAHLFAAAEVGLGRFMSDLDTANVSQNIIWNCDYVRRFLGGFAISDKATLQSSGVARFTFVADQEYVLDRRAQYQFGTDVFHLRFANPGPFIIRPVGAPLTPGQNTRNLVDIGGGLYCVDLPLVGVMNTAVLAGASAKTDYPITELASVIALQDFFFGLPPSSLPVLAEKTRTTFYSATPSSPGGAVRFLLKEFPELVGASAATSGDSEMLRDTVNPLGIREGKLDLYAASPAAVVDTLLVSLKYDNANQAFVGKLLPNGVPFKLDSITAVDAPAVALTYGGDAKIYSRSKNYAKAPMATCAYSSLEELWVVIDMPFDTVEGSPTFGDALIPLRPEGDDQVGVFQLTLRQDPLLPPVIDAVEAPGAMPWGVDVLAKGFVPIIIDSFLVQYTRRPGTVVTVDAAREEILTYVNRLARPQFYSDARVGDAMFAAGAADMVGISIQAHVQWSIANAFLPYGAPTPAEDLAAARAAAVAPQLVTIVDTKDLKITFWDVMLGTPSACFETIGPRNAMLVLDTDNLLFSES